MAGAVTGDGLVAGMRVRRPDGFVLDLAVSVAPGRTAVLLGPNGAGKSTAVAAIAGLVPLDGGRIQIGGRVVDDPASSVFVPPEDRSVGVVFQDYLLFPHLTVLENVAFGLRSRATPRVEARARAADWIERMGLAGLEEQRPHRLSGGQAQRVALARALVTEPDLLLLDEPLAALDVTTRVSLRRALEEHLTAFDGPRLLITHDPTEAFLLADEIHVVESGSLTQSGSPDDVRLRPRTPYAADLAGSNLFAGRAADGWVETGGHLLHVAERGLTGEVLVTISPTAISVHEESPGGSPRNSWETEVVRVEPLGDRVRLQTGPPLPLTVEVTSDASDALRLKPRTTVWVAIKATEIGVEPDPRSGSRGGRARRDET